MAERRVWALAAEFRGADDLLDAVRQIRGFGFRDLDALSPFPVPGLPEAIGFEDRTVPYAAAAGFVLGFLAVFAGEVWMNAIDYPLNVAGTALLAWPAFAYAAFQVGCLVAAAAAVAAMLWLNRRVNAPYDEAFRRATQDRFFVVVPVADGRFTPREIGDLLYGIGAARVIEV
ncbi:MAG: DUF3341 domain-containing protein [Rhodospirillales bacterium]|nr:DUF3341 domain-containing protein [Rhodospirillales bacterium]